MIGLTNSNCSGRCDDGVLCKPGTMVSTGQSCPAGSFCLRGVAFQCPAGTYNSAFGATNAYVVLSISVMHGRNAPHCRLTAQVSIHRSWCVPCPANKYNALPGANSPGLCFPCTPPEGSLSGASACWPGVTTVIASNPEPVFPGLSSGDQLTLYFTRPTNRPDVSTTAALLTLLEFRPSFLSTRPRGVWVAGSGGVAGAQEQLVIALLGNVDTNITASETNVVTVTLKPQGGLRDADNTCQNVSRSGIAMTGTWGDAEQPRFMTVDPIIAFNFGHQAGFGVGDGLLLRFNTPIAQVQ